MTVVPGGPILVEGPVELVTPDGDTVHSDRFVVAVCACRRSRRYPLCDTSHRRRVRQSPSDSPGTEGPAGSSNPPDSSSPEGPAGAADSAVG
ncbi:Iron-binding zinc finger CDGSH type [Amycolatopsis arida]|uniref:Iron-binding zinc finger CDGSH type n=1 Tax=Amycolatopsis arida TaxID=587909 RepID=A0A1I5XFZ4_9PSEU|nr:iron-binding CDGSH zinc finger protein [Amycolatopsis arida]SFQ30885.1 Iron-binding zinc finger CDGSH type [Amycolatopsis arida]